KMAFGAEAWVFPGGKVAEPDFDPRWKELVDGDFDDLARALRVAAVREVYEESGLLLARQSGGTTLVDADACAPLASQRFDVEDNPEVFATLIANHGLHLALDRLIPFAHWITPSMEPRRFDTHFFIAHAPERQIAAHDGREAVDHAWTTPKSVLDKRLAGKAKLMFPTRLNLEKLGTSINANAALTAAREASVVTVEPQLVRDEGEPRLRIPAEAGYSVVEESISKIME
ncbi:MAG: NUDIX hydrolase, partial [Pseudomonadota bacterium]